MRSASIFMLLGFVLVSCNTDKEDPQLISQWHLIEQLADPGDGSGTFQPVDSDKMIEFFEDGSFVSNGDLCTMAPQAGNGSTGTYSTSDSTILVDNCGFTAPYPMTFQMQGGILIVNYPCIEPCKEKYESVD